MPAEVGDPESEVETGRALVAQLEARVRAAGLWDAMEHALPRPAREPDAHLAAVLRLREFDVERALQMIAEQVKWRAEQCLDEIADMEVSEVLGCDESVIAHYLPSWCGGLDREGGPAYWIKMGQFEIKHVLEHTSFERLQLWHLRERELMMRAMRERSAREGRPINTFKVVIDLAGWHLRLMTRSSLSWITSLLHLDTELLTEYVGAIAIINVPYLFSICWAALSPFMAASTHKKVRLVSSARYGRALLDELFAAEWLPAEYGGKVPDVLRRGPPPPAPEWTTAPEWPEAAEDI